MAAINLIAVCGPTASGKTRLAVTIAQRVKGEIISADSRQVYRGMDIGTGKDLDEYTTPEGTVPHHLIDVAGPQEIYTLWHYQRDFYRVFRELRSREVMPVVVGGTGLYLEAVLRHYDIPNVPEDRELRRALMTKDKSALVEELRLLPNRPLTTDTSSKKRVVRALEVAYHGGRLPDEPGPRPPEIAPLVLAVRMDRRELRDRIARRLDQRLEEGLLDEVKRLAAGGVSRDRLDLFGLEYKHAARFLAGEVSREVFREELVRAIGQFAKRQDTYFRGMERRGVPLHWIDNADPAHALAIVGRALGLTNVIGHAHHESPAAEGRLPRG